MSTHVLAAPEVDIAAELRAMLRDVSGVDGVRRILDRLAQRLDCHAVLVNPSTVPRDDPVLHRLGSDIDTVSTRQAPVSTSLDSRPVVLLPVAVASPCPVLVVTGNAGQRILPAQRTLLADSTVPLALAWQMRANRSRQAQLDRAEARSREAVLHLLLAGATAGARRAANTLGPQLPDTIRVHLVECIGRPLTDMLRWCTRTAADAAWIVRCPVYTRHIIVLARSDADGFVEALKGLAASDSSCRIGSSPAAPVADFGPAYRQAFHALSVARHHPDRYAAYRAQGELSEILAGVGAGWAARTLAPLATYTPGRSQDPDAEELMFTLASWLNFHGLAVRHLKLHRNTLSARLRLITELLGVDLTEVSTQARLNLAVQLYSPAGGPDATLDELLTRPDVRYWAELLTEPLRGCDPRVTDTLRAWLDHRASIGATAAALRVSASGVRKRLMRVENLIQRSVLDSPSARYDLCLALGRRADPPPHGPAR
ncbi:MAG: helix-turn-helix domain-containing protein [Actinocatenispora sp.]